MFSLLIVILYRFVLSWAIRTGFSFSIKIVANILTSMLWDATGCGYNTFGHLDPRQWQNAFLHGQPFTVVLKARGFG